MKNHEIRTFTSDFLTGVTCDITQEPCPELDNFGNPAAPQFDYAQLHYSGGYGSDFDLLTFSLDIHPDLAAALFKMSMELKGQEWEHKVPKFKITIEEHNENKS